MNIKLLIQTLFGVLLFFQGMAQQTDRTIEVTGYATKLFLADKFYTSVTVKGNGQCEIPVGKHYQKYIQECKENNKKVVASREDILKGIITYFGNRISVISDPNSQGADYADAVAAVAATEVVATDPNYGGYDVSSLSKTYQVQFSVYSDAQEFIGVLKDYIGIIDAGIITAACTSITPADFEEIKLESLKNAKLKASAMATTLGATLGEVKNIYEEQPEMGSFLNNYYRAMRTTEAAYSDYLPSSTTYYHEANYPDSEGRLAFTRTTFVRFYLK